MYQVGQQYRSIKNNLIITVTKICKDYLEDEDYYVMVSEDYVMVSENRDNRSFKVSYSDMDMFIASGRLRPLNDFTPIKYLYKQPKIWQCDKDCVSL